MGPREEEERKEAGPLGGRSGREQAEGRFVLGAGELQAAGRRAGGIKPEREFQKERTLSLFLFPPSLSQKKRRGHTYLPHLRAEL